ncbi:MAG: NAD(P)-binding protein [Gammaproteobacteria bacterium]|nr:NAD(P)-binding protein [Gammaproteobacteria bacterium]
MSDSTSQPYPILSSGFELAGKKLKNRVVHASMSTRFARISEVPDKFIDYHLNRARGGAAMTITEPLNMLSQQNDPRQLNVQVGRNADKLKRLADLVESADCRLLGQIQHSGRGHRDGGRNMRARGVSALPDGLSWTVPNAYSVSEIEDIIDEWAKSAAWLKSAGFSGVEISAAHGHLFHQFFSMQSNRREDRYGGELQGRVRIITDLIHSIRRECGKDFVIGAKLPGEDGIKGGIDLEQAESIAHLVSGSKECDYLTFAWGAHADTLDWHLPDAHGPRHPYMEKIRKLKTALPDTPIGALGYITDPNEAEHALDDGTADLIMLGRPLVTDPAWAKKSFSGHEAQIRYCVSCNSCWGVIIAGEDLQCDNNPRVACSDEADWKPKVAENKKRVVIVGGGVAGMEAAWVAAERGHMVTLFASSSNIGGKTRLHSSLPGGENLSSIYDYQALAAKRAGVRIEYGVQAQLSDILNCEPDEVVLASGSEIAWPEFLPLEYKSEGFIPDLRESCEELLRHNSKESGRAVIYDHDHTSMTYAAAEYMSEIFDETIIITPRERVASDVPLVNRQGIYRRLHQKNVKIIVSSVPTEHSRFEEAELEYANVFTGALQIINDVALFTFANNRLPNTELVQPLIEAGLKPHLVGDCWAPRFVMNATAEGYAIAMKL